MDRQLKHSSPFKYILFGTIGAAILTGSLLLISWRRRAGNLAAQFLNQLELSGNSGFVDQVFQQMLQDVGWLGGEAWCMYFAKAVYIHAFPHKADAIRKILSGSTQASFAAAKQHPETFKVITDGPPMIGDIAIFQNIKDPSKGHAGIVYKHLSDTKYQLVEGNSGLGGTSEGEGVAKNERTLIIGTIDGSLKLIGFLRLKNSII